MTRPMPGPHQHDDDWYYACTACSGLWDRGDEAQRLDKHLTDAEVAAEYWREQAEWWGGMHQNGYTAEGVDIRRVATWERLATRPHAFKETP